MRQKKPYTLVTLPDGREARDYGDGIYRDANGRTMVLPANLPLITSETAHLFHAMRKQKILAAIESRIQDVTKTNAPADAIAAIVGKRAEIALHDDTRTGNEAAKIVLSAVDAYQDKRAAEQTNTTRHEYAIDDETRALLTQLLRERRDGEWIDADGTRDSDEE